MAPILVLVSQSSGEARPTECEKNPVLRGSISCVVSTVELVATRATTEERWLYRSVTVALREDIKTNPGEKQATERKKPSRLKQFLHRLGTEKQRGQTIDASVECEGSIDLGTAYCYAGCASGSAQVTHTRC